MSARSPDHGADRADRAQPDLLLRHRRGWLAANPVGKLVPGEKPRWTPKQAAILEAEQLAQVLAHTAEGYRPVSEFLAYTGLRFGEALGLHWAHID
jgi:integrase